MSRIMLLWSGAMQLLSSSVSCHKCRTPHLLIVVIMWRPNSSTIFPRAKILCLCNPLRSVATGNLHAHEGVIENASLASGNWPNKSICRLTQANTNHVAICKRLWAPTTPTGGSSTGGGGRRQGATERVGGLGFSSRKHLLPACGSDHHVQGPEQHFASNSNANFKSWGLVSFFLA